MHTGKKEAIPDWSGTSGLWIATIKQEPEPGFKLRLVFNGPGKVILSWLLSQEPMVETLFPSEVEFCLGTGEGRQGRVVNLGGGGETMISHRNITK